MWETDEATMRRRQVLARSVADDLAVAGLPIVPEHTMFRPGGVSVTVDAMTEESGGGVSVEWEAHYVLRTAAQTAVLEGTSAGHAAVEHHVTASRAMRDAIAEILTSAGYTVRTDHNDLAPFQLKVTGHAAPGPSWRDWQVARQNELMRDANSRRDAGRSS